MRDEFKLFCDILGCMHFWKKLKIKQDFQTQVHQRVEVKDGGVVKKMVRKW